MDDPIELARLSEELRSRLQSIGLDCGVPIVAPGDKFVMPKNDSGRMRLVRFFVESMSALEHEEETEPTSEAISLGADLSRGVRNCWLMRRGSSRIAVEIADAPPRADGSLRVKFRTARVTGDTGVRLNHLLLTLNYGKRILCESELEAGRKLASLISPEDYECYVVTGALSVTGKSGTLYIIRKSRPTLAFAQEPRMKALCALCMHPLGYFSSSWMGAMPPTDEVVAHLLMIRSDEHYFWRKANQIPFDEPNSGV